jgi:hypothetical protein
MQDNERLAVLRRIFANEIRKMQEEGIIKPNGVCGELHSDDKDLVKKVWVKQ